MFDTIVKFKNVIWAVLVLIALLAVLVGLIYCLVNPYPGERVIPVVQLGEASSSRKDGKQPDNIPSSSGTAVAEAGTLNELKKCKNMGDEYIASLTFLCDSTNNSVITYGADAGKVWLGAEGADRKSVV